MFSSLSWQLPVSDLLQKFDLPARWKTFLLEQFHDAIEDLRVTWPDLQSLEVHFRDIENFDPEFAQDIIDNPDDHIEASIRVLREVLIEAGAKGMNPFVRLVGFPKDMHRTVRQLRADDIGKMLSIEGLVSKITSVRRIYRASFMCAELWARSNKSSSSSPTNRNSLNRWNVASQMVGVVKPKGTQDSTCLPEILK